MNRVEKLCAYMKTSGLSDYAVFNGIKDFDLEAEDIYKDREIDGLIVYRSDSQKYLSVVGFTRQEWDSLK